MKTLATTIGVLAASAGLLCFTAIADNSGPAGRAPGQHAAEQASPPATAKSPERYKFYLRQGIPAAYRGKNNPLATNVANVIRGADRYNANCASCHGLLGFGNGATGTGLQPRPADLAWSLSNPDLKDDFLLWTISEGGVQFGTKMPSFKGELREGQIWEIVTYMRAAFEGREAQGPSPSGEKQAMVTGTH
ncbi:MAG: c-type cytochrome [Micropepsaceae bacterium]